MSTKLEILKKVIRELIKKELEEASVTGGIDGGAGPPKTPYAFKKKKKDKSMSEAKFHVRTDFGSVLIDAGSKGEAKMIVAKKLKGGVKAITSVNRVGVSQAKQVDKKIENVNEDITSSGYSQLKKIAYGISVGLKDLSKGIRSQNDDMVLPEIEYIYDKATEMKKMLKNKRFNESVNEGKYHDYRNDESLSPKQKIGHSMREVRDKLNELDKLVKMNVRLKNEIGVDSTSYWKRTHGAMKKISERLVKLANKVGQLY